MNAQSRFLRGAYQSNRSVNRERQADNARLVGLDYFPAKG
jgi:hypothetical protein